MAIALATLAIPVALLLVSALQNSYTTYELLADAAESQDFDPLVGATSTLGVMLWSAASAIGLLTYAVLRRTSSEDGPRLRRFVLAAGLGSAFMALDDAFLLHEEVLPQRVFGSAERAVLLVYMAVAAVIAVAFWRVFLRTLPGVVAGFVLLFGGSLAIDGHVIERILGVDDESDVVIYVEDGLKLIGIWLWTIYVALVALPHLRPRPSEPAATPDAPGSERIVDLRDGAVERPVSLTVHD